jgi:ABC-type multidrug transport system ATPase subunit
MSGAWIEAVYILLKNGKMMEGEKLEKVKQLVADQHFSLENILALIGAYKEEDNLVVLSSELNTLNDLFNRIVIVDNGTQVSKDEDGKVVIGGTDTVQMSDELLESIYDEVNKIRDKYVN